MAALSGALADGLRRRGVATRASLAAEAGVAVFRVAFERWTGSDRRCAGDHHAVGAGRTTQPSRRPPAGPNAPRRASDADTPVHRGGSAYESRNGPKRVDLVQTRRQLAAPVHKIHER